MHVSTFECKKPLETALLYCTILHFRCGFVTFLEKRFMRAECTFVLHLFSAAPFLKHHLVMRKPSSKHNALPLFKSLLQTLAMRCSRMFAHLFERKGALALTRMTCQFSEPLLKQSFYHQVLNPFLKQLSSNP